MRRRVYSGKPGRRILSLVLSLMMVLSCLSVSAIDVPADGPAPYSATDNIFDGTFTGDCSVDKDAGTITVNRLEDNNHVISEVTADAFILEADVSFPDGYVDAGFIFGVTDREAPGTDWTAVKIGFSNVRLFSDHAGSNLNEYGNLPSGALDNEKVHLKLAVTEDNIVSVYVNGQAVISHQYDAYHSGYIGFTSYFGSAKFENIVLRENTETPPAENEESLGGWTGSPIVDPLTGAVTVPNNNGNFHTLSETKGNAFTMEADITFLEGGDAGFLFSTVNRTDLGVDWIGIKATYSQLRLFDEGNQAGLDIREPIPEGAIVDGKFHLKLDVDAEGNIKVYLGNNPDPIISTNYDEYAAGYVGLTTYCCEAKFENIRFFNNDPVGFTTNLNGIHGVQGDWSTTSRGYRGNNIGGGDMFAMFTDTVDSSETFVFEGDMHLENSDGIGGLVFGVQNPDDPYSHWYCINVGKRWGTQTKMLKNTGGTEVWNVQRGLTQAEIEKKDYHLRLEALEGGTFNFYLDGGLVGTYVDADFTGGYFGLMTNGGDVTFNNVNYYPAQNPRITDMQLSGAQLSEPYVEGKAEYLAVADEGSDSVSITLTAPEDFVLSIDKQECESGVAATVPLNAIGYTNISIKAEDPVGHISRTFTLRVRKDADPETVYNEKYRPQFHFTPQYAFMNDPNGMLYNAATGEYHFFYQTYPYSMSPTDEKHWGHAVSKDLVHWTQLPLALSPDEYGNMWSGSGFIDYNNTAGFYDESVPPEARMVLAYAIVRGSGATGLAYTEDGGLTWTKYQDGAPVLADGWCADPKVFWYEDAEMAGGGTWVLLTSGEVKMYTSPDLKNWTYNSTLKLKNGNTISWECPDMYQVAVDGDSSNKKWVYNAAGSFYLIGDMVKDGEGKLSFQPETDPLRYNGDSFQFNADLSGLESRGDQTVYATQTFYAAPDDRIISVSWLRESAYALDETKVWNGAMTVPLETTLRTTDDGIRMYSYPVKELESLRDELIYSGTSVEVTPDSANILDGKQGTLMDIEGEFTLGDGVTEFGFKLRKGDTQETVVKYDVANQRLVMDKSKSGISYTGVSYMELKPEGNKIKMRILVDSSAIEAFGNDGISAVSSVFFPDASSNGMEFFTNGGNVTVDSLNIYSMNSAWKEQEEPEPIPTELSNLELSNGTLDPAFDKDTLNYTATVANSVSSVKVMPTYTGDTAVTVNGKDVASGSYSEDIALEVGPNAITVVAGDKTYTIVVTRETADGTPRIRSCLKELLLPPLTKTPSLTPLP